MNLNNPMPGLVTVARTCRASASAFPHCSCVALYREWRCWVPGLSPIVRRYCTIHAKES